MTARPKGVAEHHGQRHETVNDQLILRPPPRHSTSDVAGSFWRTTKRAVRALGGWMKRGYKSIDPDLVRFAKEVPVMGLTQMASAIPGDEHIPDDGHRLVIFVHGLGGSRGNFLPMKWFFSKMGRQRCVSVAFDDRTSISVMAAQLKLTVADLLDRSDLPKERSVELVCHSMGGIVARVALEDETFARMVAKIITLGTPHQGSLLARYAHTDKTLDLRPDSALMKRLESQLPWSSDEARPEVVCFWSGEDMVVVPPEAAQLEGAKNIRMDGFSHLSFLLNPRGWQAVLRELEPEAPQATGV